MKAVIFHGWVSTSQDNWFPWLKKELEKKDFDVIAPDLPDSQYPKQEKWLPIALKLTDYDEDTVLVGHSLGTCLIMRILENINKKVKAIFLVSAFDKDLGIKEIETFFFKPYDYEKIRKNAGKIYILNSDNDPYIPLNIAEELSKKLKGNLTVFHNKNHLSAGTGDFKFPELLEMISNESH
jgi:uncharacterized protein